MIDRVQLDRPEFSSRGVEGTNARGGWVFEEGETDSDRSRCRSLLRVCFGKSLHSRLNP